MSILIKTVRISGFRGLKNIEVDLEQTTILTGMNNSGKTSFLKAIQLALGGGQFISPDDFFTSENSTSREITIDLLIVPNNGNDKEFSEEWEILFTVARIRNDPMGNSIIPLRTIISFDPMEDSPKTKKFILPNWPEFKENDTNWFDSEKGQESGFYFDEVPFFYMEAQRDILSDIKLKNSYLGRMLSKIEYSKNDIEKIEQQIKSLNEEVVNKSDILSYIKKALKELDTAMSSHSEGIEITPFTPKIRDFNKGLSIYYADHNKESFSMEYHGMGTRSWSSLLTLKAFISLLSSNARDKKSAFSPVLALEEPEVHLHPNAQKKLYKQIDDIPGQKIISTHSPYIAATAKLRQIRNFYKDETVTCGKIKIDNLNDEDIRKINRQVINSRGEIFFSKMIILCEGETEEQALPIFAKEHFNIEPIEMGLDFVGVGGSGNYLPFLRFAEMLKIPWLIFSDAENQTRKNVRYQISQCGSQKPENECIIFLDDGNNFEKQLIADKFSNEIKKAIIEYEVHNNDHHRQAKQSEVDQYNNDELHDAICSHKTKLAAPIAEQIIQSGKCLPPKVKTLFEKIKFALNMQSEEV